MNRLTSHLIVPAASLALLACGSAQLNQSKLADAQAAIRSAEEVGAKDEPDAALHIELANEQIVKAKQLAEQGEEREADLMLDRAQSDAELALQLAKTKAEQSEAEQAWAKVEDLRTERAQ